MNDTSSGPPQRKPLTPAAQRALAEAEARRQAAAASIKVAPKELQGRAHALWRLGEQGHRLGFLISDDGLPARPTQP